MSLQQSCLIREIQEPLTRNTHIYKVRPSDATARFDVKIRQNQPDNRYHHTPAKTGHVLHRYIVVAEPDANMLSVRQNQQAHNHRSSKPQQNRSPPAPLASELIAERSYQRGAEEAQRWGECPYHRHEGVLQAIPQQNWSDEGRLGCVAKLNANLVDGQPDQLQAGFGPAMDMEGVNFEDTFSFSDTGITRLVIFT